MPATAGACQPAGGASEREHHPGRPHHPVSGVWPVERPHRGHQTQGSHPVAEGVRHRDRVRPAEGESQHREPLDAEGVDERRDVRRPVGQTPLGTEVGVADSWPVHGDDVCSGAARGLVVRREVEVRAGPAVEMEDREARRVAVGGVCQAAAVGETDVIGHVGRRIGFGSGSRSHDASPFDAAGAGHRIPSQRAVRLSDREGSNVPLRADGWFPGAPPGYDGLMGVDRMRFDGYIAGIGTAGGTRIVLGHWPASPYGPVSDVMVETPDNHRLLLAATAQLAEFVAATYTFHDMRVVPVTVATDRAVWSVAAGPLAVRFGVGPHGPLGSLLRVVPPPLARCPGWIDMVDLPARVVLPGVRTRGSAGNGRREWYGARDLRPITSVAATLDGRDLGPLADVDPPVRFGFGSVPRRPALVRVTTTVEVSR